MPAQNNTGSQFSKLHAVTIVAQSAIVANRFVSYGGAHAPGTAHNVAANDVQGISESDAAVGDAVSLITSYSGLVEASAAIALGDYVKPATDGSGRAAVGTQADHCGRALGVAAAAGEQVEVERVRHIHPTA